MNKEDVSYPPFPMKLPSAQHTRSPMRQEMGKLSIQGGRVVTKPSFPFKTGSTTPPTPTNPATP